MNQVSPPPTNQNFTNYKLASSEVQGPKPPLVGGSGQKLALFSIVLILVAGAGIAGYYFYAKNFANPLPTATPSVSPAASPAADKNLDTDKDGMPDRIEAALGTNPSNAGTDGDTYSDLTEIKNGYSPLIAGSAGKYTAEQWQSVKDKIKAADREFYEKEFGNETADWKTYQNEEYGFEVKFPSDLVLQKNTGEAYTSFSGKLAGESYLLQLGYISQNTLNTMGISYCQSYPNDSRCENYSSDSLEFLIDWNIETEGAFTQSRAEILKPESGMIIISILHSPSQDIRSFFRQILSTFKFISQKN